MKFSNILVPIDFSDHSLNALKWACNMAKKAGADIHVLHSYGYTATYAQDHYFTFIESIADDINHRLIQDMKALENTIPELAEVNPHYEVSFDFVLKGITDYVQNKNIDLVVMGTRGRNGLNNRLIGSVTSALINHVTIPVLAIPENHITGEISSIVIADDFEHLSSDKMLIEAAYIAALYKAQVKILLVIKNKAGIDIETDEVLKIGKAFKGIPHTYSFTEHKNFDEGILQFVEKEKADMLIIFPQKHGFFTSIFRQSVTESVVHKIKIPMLAIKPELT